MNPSIKDKVYSIDFHIGVAHKTIYIYIYIYIKNILKEY